MEDLGGQVFGGEVYEGCEDYAGQDVDGEACFEE